MYTVGPQTANSTPCHFEQQCFFVISSGTLLLSFRAQPRNLHIERSAAPLSFRAQCFCVISSAARSAKSRNLHKKYASNEERTLLKRSRVRQGCPCPTQIHHHVVVTVALVSSPPASGRGPYNRTPNCAKAQHEVL